MLSKEDAKVIMNIVDDLMDCKESEVFRQPVDYKALNLIDYPIIIKHPMDLGTVKKKIKGNKYKTISDALDDIQLIWSNCKLYNQEGSPIYKYAQKMEKYTKKFVKKYLSLAKPPTQVPTTSFGKPKAPEPIFQEESKMETQGNEFEGRIPFDQKLKFSKKMKMLTQDQLVKVIHFILDGSGGALKEMNKEKMQIKIDDLSLDVFQRINNYMEDIFNAEEKQFD